MANGHDKGLDNNPESRLSIHEVPEQISRIFFGKPDVRFFSLFWRENSNIFTDFTSVQPFGFLQSWIQSWIQSRNRRRLLCWIWQWCWTDHQIGTSGLDRIHHFGHFHRGIYANLVLHSIWRRKSLPTTRNRWVLPTKCDPRQCWRRNHSLFTNYRLEWSQWNFVFVDFKIIPASKDFEGPKTSQNWNFECKSTRKVNFCSFCSCFYNEIL